ncbi:MAG: hypothetical protein LBG47_00735 [Prevotellaceae bacterium]|jgi:hypothetical protein|nr:hypothetical protein [Prevotellaceae bacterium]
MEPEELKNVWKSIDEHLKKQEVLKENIIRKMIYDRANRSLSKLMRYEMLGIAVILFAIPTLAFLANFKPFREQMQGAGGIFVWGMLAICAAYLAWSLIKIVALTKVDFTKNIKETSLLVAGYNIWIQKEKIVSAALSIAIALGAIWMYMVGHATIFQWTSLACALTGGIFLTCYMFRVYDRNISAIRQSLEELKEPEEEI